MGKKVHKAVIPAAGLGTRFLPATKAIPKEMLPIVDVPTIQLVVEEAVRAGITDVVMITGRGKVSIVDHFDHAYELEHTLRERGKADVAAEMDRLSEMVRIIAIRQKTPMGLGHAVLCAREAVGDEAFALLLGDDLIDNDDDPGIGQLARVYEETGAGAIAIMEVPEGQEHMYGIVAGDWIGEQGEPEGVGATAASPTGRGQSPRGIGGRLRIREMVEKPRRGTAPSRLAIVGRYVLPPSIWPMLAETKPGHGGEIQITDALKGLAASEVGLFGIPVRGVRHDAGDKLGYLRANLAYALKRDDLREPVRALMRELLGE